MARHSRKKRNRSPKQGFDVRQKTPGGIWTVRFWHGKTIERSTGTRDETLAKEKAQRIYAATISTEPAAADHAKPPSGSLEEALTQWQLALKDARAHATSTIKTWHDYAKSHWLNSTLTGMPRWLDTSDLTAGAVRGYVEERLRNAEAETVKKEASALRNFLTFVKSPVLVPKIGKNAHGTAYAKDGKLVKRRTTAPDVSPEQVEVFLDGLPEYSTSKRTKPFLFRARFVVGYETSLRPTLLDRIQVPRHYRKGAATILITRDLEKGKYAREVYLSQRARDALDAIAPTSGLIFGKHDYRHHLQVAARAAFPADVADRFCGAHLRSARITHALEKTGNIPGVQFMAGHKWLASTNRYVKPSLRAAVDVVKAMDAHRAELEARAAAEAKPEARAKGGKRPPSGSGARA